MAPSGEKATAATTSVWPVSVALTLAASTSQSLMVLSALAVARVLPSGENDTAPTQASWPRSVSGSVSAANANGEARSSTRRLVVRRDGTDILPMCGRLEREWDSVLWEGARGLSTPREVGTEALTGPARRQTMHPPPSGHAESLCQTPSLASAES